MPLIFTPAGRCGRGRVGASSCARVETNSGRAASRRADPAMEDQVRVAIDDAVDVGAVCGTLLLGDMRSTSAHSPPSAAGTLNCP